MLDFNQRSTEILGETGSKKSKNEKNSTHLYADGVGLGCLSP